MGQLAVENGHYVVETLARACDGCLNGEFAALITGPVHKGVINDAGIPFTGHTEFFEERSQAKKVVMMLVTEELRVALATRIYAARYRRCYHPCPFARSDCYFASRFAHQIWYCRTAHSGLQAESARGRRRSYGYGRDRHHYSGTQRAAGTGDETHLPLPADTLFQPKYLDNADAVLAMYHDQVFPC